MNGDETMDITEIRVNQQNLSAGMALVSAAMLRGRLFRRWFDPITDEIVYQVIDPDSMWSAE